MDISFFPGQLLQGINTLQTGQQQGGVAPMGGSMNIGSGMTQPGGMTQAHGKNVDSNTTLHSSE